MNSIILQPSGNKDAREHYQDTISNPVSLNDIKMFVNKIHFEALKEIYPTEECMIWGVTPSKINIGKWNRIRKGDVTLFSKSGGIFASAVTTYKLHNERLANHLWKTNNKGQTWEYIYFLDEVVEHNIPYADFNSVVGYAPNYIIQGFNVLDQQKSKLIFDEFGLESSVYLPDVNDNELEEISIQLEETDSQVTTLRRLEQGYLKKHLFGNKVEGKCSFCGNKYPISLLVAAHIKKRAHCNHQERLDLNVVMPMCKLGCDEIFEKGYVFVDQGIIKRSSHKSFTSDLMNYVKNLEGANCPSYNTKSAKYFDWHRSFHKNH